MTADRTPPPSPAGVDRVLGAGGRGERPAHGRLGVCLGAVAVLVVSAALAQTRLWRPDTEFGIKDNVQIGEAEAWWHGRLDLPERQWDTALYQDAVYSYFPPMFTIVAAGVVPFCGAVPHVAIVGLAALVPLLAYILFQQRTASALWGAVLALGFVCGTSAWPVLDKAVRGASPYHVNHVLSLIGILLILLGYFERPRVGLMSLGFVLTALSRQLTAAFLLPAVYVAFLRGDAGRRWHRLAVVASAGLLAAGVQLGLNAAKFGHPLTTGYMLNHAGRDDVFAREARAHGLLAAHWVKRNLYYANLGFPEAHRVQSGGERAVYWRPNHMGTGIWWTTPLLLWLLVEPRRYLGDRRAVVLLAAAGLVFTMQLFWHATGADQRGYNRYSLDYLPALLALIAPGCVSGRRRWVTVALIAWGVFYFRVVLGWPHVRVWG